MAPVRISTVLGAVVLVAAACGGGSQPHRGATATTSAPGATTPPSGGPGASSGPGVSSDAVQIGIITSTVGIAAAQFTNYPKGIEARIDLQNAKGGVDGRKIQVTKADDAGSLPQDLTAAKELVSRHVFAVIPGSPLFFFSAKYLNQLGMPVIGSGFDGPEWGQQPYTNMFSTVPTDPHYPQYTGGARFFKEHGATNVGALGYGISPSSSIAAKGVIFAAKSQGLKGGYLNTSIPFGSVDLSSASLGEEHAGIDGLYVAMDDNTNVAAITAAKQAGVKLKVALAATGYDQTLLGDPTAVQNAQGSYFSTAGTPVELKTPATRTFTAALKKYEGFSGVPGYDYYEGWQDADLLIKGLQVTGRNLSQASFMSQLRTVKDWNAGGLLPTPVDFTLAAFGQPTLFSCTWYVQLKGHAFVPTPADGKPTCGTLIPNSNQS